QMANIDEPVQIGIDQALHLGKELYPGTYGTLYADLEGEFVPLLFKTCRLTWASDYYCECTVGNVGLNDKCIYIAPGCRECPFPHGSMAFVIDRDGCLLSPMRFFISDQDGIIINSDDEEDGTICDHNLDDYFAGLECTLACRGCKARAILADASWCL